MTYREKLQERITTTGSNLCVGIDPRFDKIEGDPKEFLLRFVEETHEFAAVYKPNIAYFEALGIPGLKLLEATLEQIPDAVPVVLDAKRGDIGETQKYYAKACFDIWGVDAVTLNPYMGAETLEPFLDYPDKGAYLLGVTSNPGSADLQLRVSGDRQIFEFVAEMTKKSDQVGLVLGLTNAAPEILPRIPDVPLLIPGLGAQGGDLSVLKSQNRQAPNLINASRGIMFAEPELSFAEKASRYVGQIQEVLG